MSSDDAVPPSIDDEHATMKGGFQEIDAGHHSVLIQNFHLFEARMVDTDDIYTDGVVLDLKGTMNHSRAPYGRRLLMEKPEAFRLWAELDEIFRSAS